MTIRPLTDSIGPASGSKRSETDPDINPGWYQFILDQKAEIRARAEQRVIPVTVFTWAAYDLKRWMRAERIPLSMEWIIRIINDQMSDLDFHDLESIFIPAEGHIRTLFAQYRSGLEARPLR